jgi:hypothetical protein
MPEIEFSEQNSCLIVSVYRTGVFVNQDKEKWMLLLNHTLKGGDIDE